ncbi:hypothetical protein FB451DRAFT_142598 [Mycena latifolia]|nr:hypothetical protein FB451DRAFT_142598 [Mycena latifolia]
MLTKTLFLLLAAAGVAVQAAPLNPRDDRIIIMPVYTPDVHGLRLAHHQRDYSDDLRAEQYPLLTAAAVALQAATLVRAVDPLVPLGRSHLVYSLGLPARRSRHYFYASIHTRRSRTSRHILSPQPRW